MCEGGGRARRTGVEPGSPGACEGSVPAAGRRCMQQTEQQRLGRSAGARGCTGCMKPAWGTPALAAPAAAAAAAAAGAAHSMASVRDPQLALPAPPFFSVTCLHKAGVQGCVFQPKQASKQAQRSSSTAECMRMQACPAAWPAARCRHAHMGARKQSVCLAQRGVRRYGACAADCSAAGSLSGAATGPVCPAGSPAARAVLAVQPFVLAALHVVPIVAYMAAGVQQRPDRLRRQARKWGR